MTLTVWIAIASVAGLGFYCFETWKIRLAAEGQLEAQRTPCLTFAATPRDGSEAILDMDGARGTMILNFVEGDAVLHNIGNGPAVNIGYVLTSEGHPRLDGYVPFIPPAARASIPVARNSLQGRKYECSIQYDSLSFTRYETRVVVQNVVLTPPFRFGKAKIKKQT